MLFDKTATLRHVAHSAEDYDDEETIETVLHGVSWYAQRKAAPGKGGMTAACAAKCRIPEDVLGDVLPCVGDTLTCDSMTVTICDVHDNRGRGMAGHVYVEGQ